MLQRHTGSLAKPSGPWAAIMLALFLALAVGADQSPETPEPNTVADDATATNRPLREPRAMALTVGQTTGDLRGTDDKVIQAGIEYLNRLGGGTLHIGPGVYVLRNSIYLSSNIALEGSGPSTVLRKAPSVVTPLTRDADWFECGVQVLSPAGFLPGGGIMLRIQTGPEDWQYDILQATVTAIQGNVLYLDGSTQENFWVDDEATAGTLFPLLVAEGADNVSVQDIVLDGNRRQNEYVNGNFAGAVFIQNCHNWHLDNVVARDYNGDGFSFQACDDIEFVECQALDNADLGFHPGSGSQRPVFDRCLSRGNDQGLFFCWSVSDGLVEDCILTDNRLYGISIGHRDTDNLIAGCTIERNGQAGVYFRDEDQEFRGGHRNRIEQCTFRDNGTGPQGVAIDIQGQTHDIMVCDSRFENTPDTPERIAIRIGKKARRITLEDNTFERFATTVQDLRPTTIDSN